MGGAITGCKADDGGGVCLTITPDTDYNEAKSPYFKMMGGSIEKNVAEYYRGGGVAVFNGTFLMTGGQIIDNEAYYGGGVYVYDDLGTVKY